MTSAVSSMRRTTRWASRLRGIHARLLIQPRLLRDQLQREQPIDLTPCRSDLRRHGVAENLADGSEQVLTDDRVPLGADAQRYVLVRDSRMTWSNGGASGIDQLHGVGDNRAGKGFALLTGRLIPLA